MFEVDYNLDKIDEVAASIIDRFRDDKVFTFKGNLGAGKTTLIQSLCNVLGVNNKVLSPTFSLVNEYKTTEGKKVFHFDLYRIKSPEEAFDFGLDEYLFSGSYCFMEWPEIIKDYLPKDAVHFKLDKKNEKAVLRQIDL